MLPLPAEGGLLPLTAGGVSAALHCWGRLLPLTAGGVYCPSLLGGCLLPLPAGGSAAPPCSGVSAGPPCWGVSAAPRCWEKCLLTLSGVGSLTCSVPGNQPPAPAGGSLAACFSAQAKAPLSGARFQVPCPLPPLYPAPARDMELGLWAFPMCLAGGSHSYLGPLWGAPGASRVTVIFPW